MTSEDTTTRRDSSAQFDDNDPRVRVECYVRSSTLSTPVEETIERLEAQADDGTVDRLRLHAWPKRVALDGPLGESDVVETFEGIETWADQWDVSVRPPFAVEQRTDDIAGRSGEVLVTPTVCLAVYVEGALVGAFPHEAADGTVRVEDALQAIEAGEVVANGEGRAPASAENRDDCSVCGGDLVNGQGLYHCPDCDRTVLPAGDRRTTSSEERSMAGPEIDARATAPTPPAE